MSIITIDPSLICTAMVVDGEIFVYTANHISLTGKGEFKRWFELCKPHAKIRSFDLYNDTSLSFTDSELAKLNRFSKVCDKIIEDITNSNVDLKSAKVAIEGYSYSSVSGPLIDLVTFGTMLRYTLMLNGVTDINIIPPQELKNKAASLVYAPVVKGKITKYINNLGVSAGSFKKQDMLQCLIDDATLSLDDWVIFLNSNKDELCDLKSTPKPIEDINDAKLLYEWFRRNI